MSAENIEKIRRGFEAINAGDLEAVLEVMHPDIVLAPSVVGGVEGTIFQGHAGYRLWWRDTLEVYEETSFDVSDVRANGNAVVALYTTHVRGGLSGIELDRLAATVVWFEDGLVVRQQGYQDQAEALAAAGLA